MKLENATFRFKSGDGEYCVVFQGNVAKVLPPNSILPVDFDNSKKTYKPCVTHCEMLIKRTQGTAVAKNPREQRQTNETPQLPAKKKLKAVR